MYIIVVLIFLHKSADIPSERKGSKSWQCVVELFILLFLASGD